jgi:hypothetical protein
VKKSASTPPASAKASKRTPSSSEAVKERVELQRRERKSAAQSISFPAPHHNHHYIPPPTTVWRYLCALPYSALYLRTIPPQHDEPRTSIERHEPYSTDSRNLNTSPSSRTHTKTRTTHTKATNHNHHRTKESYKHKDTGLLKQVIPVVATRQLKVATAATPPGHGASITTMATAGEILASKFQVLEQLGSKFQFFNPLGREFRWLIIFNRRKLWYRLQSY